MEPLIYDQRDKCTDAEKSMMFKKTKSDGRIFIATFQSPEGCKAFVDNYNELLATINMLNWQLQEAIDEIGNHR